MAKLSLNILILNRMYDNVFGGVEFISTSLANALNERGHLCVLTSLDKNDATMLYQLNPNIIWERISSIDARQKASWGERLNRQIKLRRIIIEHNIDVIIGFQDGCYLLALFASIFLKVKLIAAERNTPLRFQYLGKKYYKKFLFFLFRFSDCVTVQNASFTKFYPNNIQKKIEVIPNPVTKSNGVKSIKQIVQREKIFLSVGRLEYQKNFAVLINAFSEFCKYNSCWKLVIVGDGTKRKELQDLINSRGLEGKVKLVGYTSRPYTYYDKAQIFCMPSLWEGFPNALAEAMKKGLPAIGFSKCGGVSDLINHEENGLLVDGPNQIDALYQGMKFLANNPTVRRKMSVKAKTSMKSYTPEIVFDKWEALLFNLKQG